MMSFFCIGITFGNLTSIAMKPLGRIAKTVATVIGSLSTFISIPIGQLYDQTIYPIVLNFIIVAFCSFFIMIYLEKFNPN